MKDRCLEGGSFLMPNKPSFIANELSIKIHNEEGPLNIRLGMDGSFGSESHMAFEVTTSKFGGSCKVGSSSMECMEVNHRYSKNTDIEVNCKS